jgi:hypothetical protein
VLLWSSARCSLLPFFELKIKSKKRIQISKVWALGLDQEYSKPST